MISALLLFSHSPDNCVAHCKSNFISSLIPLLLRDRCSTNNRVHRYYCYFRSWYTHNTVQQRHQLLSCCQTFKIIHDLDCLNFDDYLCFNRSPTRSHSLTLRCTRSRINSFRYSFFVNIPILWNTIPYDIVNSTSMLLLSIS